ncbi:MAG TPA: DUF5320 domain-containing protein [Ignavibacteriaceae bacterium]
MPNFDGTGPQGQGAMTGRRRGRCQDTQTTQIEKSENRIAENKDVVYGFGRGGRPRGGGGLGNHHAGGYGKGQGRGRGRGFENK